MTTQPGRPVHNANRDAFDRRDRIYSAPLVELPSTLMPNWDWIEPLNQGKQGACTGFGLAAVINYLLAGCRRARARGPEERSSARMLFKVARRYGQWAGKSYDRSSARGAMKGWFRTGFCSEALRPNKAASSGGERLTRDRQLDALRTLLGAYYRLLPRPREAGRGCRWQIQDRLSEQSEQSGIDRSVPEQASTRCLARSPAARSPCDHGSSRPRFAQDSDCGRVRFGTRRALDSLGD